jgi:hypothetical protein
MFQTNSQNNSCEAPHTWLIISVRMKVVISRLTIELSLIEIKILIKSIKLILVYLLAHV